MMTKQQFIEGKRWSIKNNRLKSFEVFHKLQSKNRMISIKKIFKI